VAELESLGEVISTDVLIVGGGLAGLAAAITVKEESPENDVLVVEKATAGWAGKAPKGGGILAFITPEDTPEEFIRFHLRNIGCFLEDQELLSEYARTCNEVLDYLDSWGVKLAKEKNGRWKYIKLPGGELPWGLVGADLDMCQRIHRYTKKLGSRFVNKVSVVGLLKDGDQVTGAIGFNAEDGTCYIFKAKATILANGSQNYRIMPMWSPGRGDGIAAAYRAGAEMRNAEFGSFINMIHTASREVVFGAEECMYNAKGENITRKYRPLPQPDIHTDAAIAWHKEHLDGNGPIYENADENLLGRGSEILFATDLVWDRPVAIAFWLRLWEKEKPAMKDDSPRREIVPGFIGELSPVKVDHQMATTLPGLFAVGDISYNGSAWTGAVPAPPGRIRGTGLMNAVWSARRGARVAARFVRELSAEPKVDLAHAQELKEGMFQPLQRESGIAPTELVHAIQEAVAPIKYSNWRSEERMKEALGMVLDVRAKLPELKARDTHDLAACNEAKSMALCAEMFYRASLERKESRGWFVREDFPETDNVNWLKWIILKDKDGEMTLSTEDIPIERYSIKP
jgi:succinate dehydrogenase/fumarate reductase flavoprotein subunit